MANLLSIEIPRRTLRCRSLTAMVRSSGLMANAVILWRSRQLANDPASAGIELTDAIGADNQEFAAGANIIWVVRGGKSVS